MGIGDPVEHEEEGRPPPARAAQLVEIDLLEGAGPGQHPLGGVGAGGGGQPSCRDHHQPGAPARRQALDLVDLRRRLEVLGHPHLAHRTPTGGQQLPHRLATLDLLAAERTPAVAGRLASLAAGPPAAGTALGWPWPPVLAAPRP